jgi:16S rRNA (uracil1498-N3)-methyltransferase
MTRRRWIADEVSGKHAALTGNHAEHLTRVLRARVGQEFDIAAGTRVHRARITSVERSRVEFELGDEIYANTIPSVAVALSIFKFDRLEWAIEKCTELGAARIVPVIAQRTEAHLVKAATKRRDRWQRIARAASEQSRRISSPEISPVTNFKDAVALPGHTRIVLAESEDVLMLKDAVQSSSGDVMLAFGPEGGWTEAELGVFFQAGWVSASLGSTILRAETAVIAALAVTFSQLQQHG